jgi:small-conductance mechanosensitive channel
MLMMFENARSKGAGPLTTAGLLGIVVGLVVQRSIPNLLVGIQMAINQPVKIDNMVIVEDAWRKVEEINSNYAIIMVWDQRSGSN